MREERERARKIKHKRCLGKVSVASICPSPWCHSPTASLPIKALIKTDKVSPNEERAVGGLNCWSLSITLPEESSEGRARGYGNDTRSRGGQRWIDRSFDALWLPMLLQQRWITFEEISTEKLTSKVIICSFISLFILSLVLRDTFTAICW